MEKQKKENYFLGLDIGTNSVGYAVTDDKYKLLKFKGEPMWGVQTFESANQSADRRAFRTARRRLDRRQQRVALINELFAREIAKVDTRFFIRRKESSLWREDASSSGDKFIVFNDANYTDKNYYRDYPTIHHLINRLMTAKDGESFDVRLVYMACAWLVAHRGHFLSEVSKDNIDNVLDFSGIYNDFCSHFIENGYEIPWRCKVEDLQAVLKMKKGISVKEKELLRVLYDGKNPVDDEMTKEVHPYKRKYLVKLLAGGTVKPKDLFDNDAYEETKSISLGMPDEDYVAVLAELDSDGEIINKLKAIYDWSVLIDVLGGCKSISEAKVKIYNQHKEDLKNLKKLIKKYCPDRYKEVFVVAKKETKNYVAYSSNTRSVGRKSYLESDIKTAKKEDFYKYIKGILSKINYDEDDQVIYNDILQRIETFSYMPKQVDTDNRVIPYQLYWYELNMILRNAENYLPFLKETDESGVTITDKILSVFEFRVPYYVGPLRNDGNNKNAWIQRKAGKIYPWNFNDLVDRDSSEQLFIDRMTNSCTYLPGETVIPKYSLLYTRYTVLNEINTLKIDGAKITPAVKQEIYNEIFLKYRKVTKKRIKDYLVSNGYMDKSGVLDGVDDNVKSSLKPLFDFRQLLSKGVLDEKDVEKIIERITYSEDKRRLSKWLKTEYSHLSESDIKYIAGLNYKDFGRLSKKFLAELLGTEKIDGEMHSIMYYLWESNENLMQLLSERFSFMETIEEERKKYYRENPAKVENRLEEMYVPNAVKRPILRTLDIIDDIVKATGTAPAKIFVEMARGGEPDKKGKRTSSRKEQLLALYKIVKDEDTKLMEQQLEAMGDSADNKLQSEALYLYYLQLGKCMYSGKPIALERLKEDYNIDHIYPQSYVKDDSILNNKVLVLSTLNGEKGDKYPIKKEIRESMGGYWYKLKECGLITDEKYKRLIRHTSFSADEKLGFINRQLVETTQSTKAVATLLKERFPETEIVYVKAGLVSDFRHEYGLEKSRLINDLHHAKDAYLNIVVGNVYHTRFNKKWFFVDNATEYSLKTKTLFGHRISHGDYVAWSPDMMELIKKTSGKNAVHTTRYAFCRKGGLFDQNPLKARECDNAVPLKKFDGSDRYKEPQKYGYYNKPTASFFVLVKYQEKKPEVMIMPVDLLYGTKFLEDEQFAIEYSKNTIQSITKKPVTDLSFPLGKRIIKVNTVFSLDGFRVCLGGKDSGGNKIGFKMNMSLSLDVSFEKYIKKIEKFYEKIKSNPKYVYNEMFDIVNSKDNIELYFELQNKMKKKPFCTLLGSFYETLEKGKDTFCQLNVIQQSACLIQILSLFKEGRSNPCDLSLIGSKETAKIRLSSKLSNWTKRFQEVYIIDQSASGLFENKSKNLLDLL